jgi:hypothetical protein
VVTTILPKAEVWSSKSNGRLTYFFLFQQVSSRQSMKKTLIKLDVDLVAESISRWSGIGTVLLVPKA